MKSGRYFALDGIRGLALLNMIAYHAVWDLVYLFGFDLQWYQSEGTYIWQKKLKRGVTVFSLGFLIVLATLIAMPQNRVRFGVLTLIGSCMLLMIPAEKVLRKCRPVYGLIFSITLFLLTRNINHGYLGFANWNLLPLPDNWYHNFVTTCKLLTHLESSKSNTLEWFGRHSLGLYMIHQPLLYFLFAALFAL